METPKDPDGEGVEQLLEVQHLHQRFILLRFEEHREQLQA